VPPTISSEDEFMRMWVASARNRSVGCHAGVPKDARAQKTEVLAEPFNVRGSGTMD
jgi:hypothetical protein